MRWLVSHLRSCAYTCSQRPVSPCVNRCGYPRVPKFSPYGSVCCACAQRPCLPVLLAHANVTKRNFSTDPKLTHPTVARRPGKAFASSLFSLVAVLVLFAHDTAGYLSFHPMAQCAVHALKGLAYRACVTPASSPAAYCKQCSTRAAAPVLLALA